MQYTLEDLAILIATKDRHCQLQKLLDSISHSTHLPNKIAIVYSGKNITSIANLFRNKMNIDIIFSPVASQMYQKSIGIKALGITHQWVFFLDDDVVLEIDTIEKLYSEYLSNPVFKDFVGFGLSILNRSTRRINLFTKGILKFFGLYSNSPGTITKSGHAQSYLDHPVEIEVKWLNGISVWRSRVLSQYPVIQTNSTYSAYEDVNFSYKISKENKLLFAQKAKVVNQSTEGDAPLSINQFLQGGYLRYKFVFANIEFSKWRLMVAQFVRALDFIFRSNENCKMTARISVALSLWFNLLVLALTNKNIDDFL